MRRVFSLALPLFLALACYDGSPFEPTEELPVISAVYALNTAVKTEVTFTVAVTEFVSGDFLDAGKSGRGKMRDFHLTFEVTGDVEGVAQLVLNSNWDAPSWWATGPGRASAWGELSVMTDNGTWTGNLTGEFVFDPDLHPWNAQLFSKVNLHGPDQQKLKAICDETTPESEVMLCTGQILAPRG